MTKKSSKSEQRAVEPQSVDQGRTPDRPGDRTLGLVDWFDRWPELFAQRWPESFRGIPFVDEMCRVEQAVDDDGTVVVRAELPGLDPDRDVTVTVDEGRLTIAGRREDRSEHRESGSYRTEFRYGSFERTVRLPAGAKADEVTAAYHDGILEVRVPVDAASTGATTVPIARRE